MSDKDDDIKQLVQSYFDCGWEEFESDEQVQRIVTEMKDLSDMYLKVKSSKSENGSVAAKAMESELKKLKAELVKVVDNLKSQNQKESKEDELKLDMDATKVEEVKPVKTKSKSQGDKLSAMAMGLAAIALAGVGYLFFLNQGNYISREELESYKTTFRKSLVNEMTEANQVLRTEMDTVRNEITTLRQEVEAAKLEMNGAKQEVFNKLNSQTTEINQKLSFLESSLKKSSAKPIMKPAPKPTSKPASKSVTKPTAKKPVKRK